MHADMLTTVRPGKPSRSPNPVDPKRNWLFYVGIAFIFIGIVLLLATLGPSSSNTGKAKAEPAHDAVAEDASVFEPRK